MIEHPQLDWYTEHSSPIHRWDPRVKLISILCLIFAIVLISDLRMAFLGLIIAVIIVLASRIPIGFVLKRLSWVGMFILPLSLIVVFTYHEGAEIASFGFLTVTWGGVNIASLIFVRAISAILLVFPLIGTTRFDVTIKALERLKIPSKLVQMITFTYRYIFVLGEEVQRMLRAVTSRGFRRGLNIRTMKLMGQLIGMLFIRASERAERVYAAMASRGYEESFKSLADFKICKADIVKAALVIAIAIFLNVF